MSLKDQIMDQVKTAMREQNKARLATLRLIQAAIKQIEVDERITLNDEQVISVLTKMIKQRRESIAQYSSANRQDLVDQEEQEVAVIQEFMPEQLSAEEIITKITVAIAQVGATSMKDMGKVVGLLKPELEGRADMGAVSQQVKLLLNS